MTEQHTSVGPQPSSNMYRWWLVLVFIIKYCYCGPFPDPDKFISQANLQSSTCLTEKTIAEGLTSDPTSGHPRWLFACGYGFITNAGDISTFKSIADVTDEYACMRECEFHRDQGCEGNKKNCHFVIPIVKVSVTKFQGFFFI